MKASNPRSLPEYVCKNVKTALEKQADQKGLIVFLLSSPDEQIMSHYGGDLKLCPEADWPRLVSRSD